MTGKTTEINVSEDAGIRHVKWELESDLGIPSALQVLAGIGKKDCFKMLALEKILHYI